MAARRDIVIPQGADFIYSALLQNQDDSSAVDLTGYTVAAQVRETTDADTVLATMTGAIASDPTTGGFTAKLLKAVTSTMAPGKYVWDLFLLSTASPSIKLLYGYASVVPATTRP